MYIVRYFNSGHWAISNVEQIAGSYNGSNYKNTGMWKDGCLYAGTYIIIYYVLHRPLPGTCAPVFSLWYNTSGCGYYWLILKYCIYTLVASPQITLPLVSTIPTYVHTYRMWYRYMICSYLSLASPPHVWASCSYCSCGQLISSIQDPKFSPFKWNKVLNPIHFLMCNHILLVPPFSPCTPLYKLYREWYLCTYLMSPDVTRETRMRRPPARPMKE